MRPARSATQANSITEGVIWKQLLKFFFPILLGTFFQQLYNTVDAIVVGNYVGKEALAAVGGTTAFLINLLVGFFVGLSSGATVVISQHYGAKDREGVSRGVHTAVTLALLGGAVLTGLGIVVAPWGLRVMNTPPDILEGSLTYMRIYFGGVLFMLLYNMGTGILRAIGDSRRPLYILIVCCLLNVGLDLLLVKRFQMGVAGAALATVITEGISAVLVLAILMRSRECYRLHPKRLRVDGPLLRSILHIGFPAGLQSMMYSISNIFIQAGINRFGTDIIAGWTAFGKIDSLFWMIMDAFGISITTFVGQNVGAHRLDRVRGGIRTCTVMALGASLAFSVVLYFFSDRLVLLFNSDAGVIRSAVRLMKCCYPYYFTYVLIGVLGGAMRGAGDSLRPMLMIAGGICLFRIVWIAIAGAAGADVTVMVSSYPASWAFTSLLFIPYYLRGHWLSHARTLQC